MKKLYKNSNLIIYLIGIFVSGIGTKLTTIALSDKILKLTGSNFNVSLVFMLQSLPILILGITAGNIIDKNNKKLSFILINAIFAITSFTFSLTSNSIIIFSVVLINGIVQAFYIPCGTSLMPLLVNKEDLSEANGVKMSINGIVMIAGYAFAGILVSFVGNNLAFILDSLSFIIIALASSFLKLSSTRIPNNHSEKASIKKGISAGWNFIKNNLTIKSIFFIDLIVTLIISMQSPLTYVFVEKYLGGTTLMARRSGFLFSFAGIGTIFGGFLIGKFRHGNKLLLLATSLVFDSIIVIIFSLNRYFPASLLLYGSMGVVGAFNGGILQTVIQEKTPENILGRVSGFISSIVEPISVLSLLIGGICSSFIEVKWIFIIGSLLELSTGLFFLNFYYKKHNS